MASLLQYSRLTFAAAVLSSVEFGLYITITAITLYLMFRRPIWSFSKYLTLVYVCLSLANNIIGYSTSTIYQEAAVVEMLADTPVQHILDYCSPVSVASAFSANFQVLASDLLMIYRTYAVFGNKYFAMIWLGVFYLALLVVTIFTDLICLGPEYSGSIWLPSSGNLNYMFNALTALIELAATGLIVLQLSQARRAVHPVSRSAKSYSSIIGILIDSAALYTITSIVFLALSAAENWAIIWWAQLSGSMAFLSPALIILRAEMGKNLNFVQPPDQERGKA